MSSDQEALTLHQVKAHDVKAFAACKTFQSGVSIEQVLPAWILKSHNNTGLLYSSIISSKRFTQYYPSKDS